MQVKYLSKVNTNIWKYIQFQVYHRQHIGIRKYSAEEWPQTIQRSREDYKRTCKMIHLVDSLHPNWSKRSNSQAKPLLIFIATEQPLTHSTTCHQIRGETSILFELKSDAWQLVTCTLAQRTEIIRRLWSAISVNGGPRGMRKTNKTCAWGGGGYFRFNGLSEGWSTSWWLWWRVFVRELQEYLPPDFIPSPFTQSQNNTTALFFYYLCFSELQTVVFLVSRAEWGF